MDRYNQSPWPLTHFLMPILLWLLLLGICFYGAVSSAMSVWYINDTFNHCFFVVPGVVYLVWLQRGAVLEAQPKTSFIGLLGVFGAIAVYSVGIAAHIELLQHLSIFGLLPAMALFLFGWRIFRILLIPLLFTMFSVPVGEELIPLFQDITADMAVALLKTIDVPVFRDGLYISVPNGNFVVAEACSGVRFFIACVVIGCAYAYMNFVSKVRAWAFILFSIIMPIIANGFRAFGIILVGHLTEMEHAVGADHLVYGWFFFSLVVIVLMICGYFFSDGVRPFKSTIGDIHPGWAAKKKSLMALSILPFVGAGLIQITLKASDAVSFEAKETGRQLAEEVSLAKSWTPKFKNAQAYYVDERNPVALYRAVYKNNSSENEMISWDNREFDIDRWTIRNESRVFVEGLGNVRVLDLTSIGEGARLLAYWYVAPGRVTSSRPKIKLQQAFNTLTGRPSGGMLVAFSYPFSGEVEAANVVLQKALENDAKRLSEYSIIENP